MRGAVAVARFIGNFLVGDDPQIAFWVTVSLLGTRVLSHGGVSAWWLLPLVVAGVLVLSLFRAAAVQRRPGH
jgi:hypothetical protein